MELSLCIIYCEVLSGTFFKMTLYEATRAISELTGDGGLMIFTSSRAVEMSYFEGVC